MDKKKKTKIEFIPIMTPCTYPSPDPKTGICRNCDGTGQYKDGYYMVYEVNGKKFAFTVDTVK